MLTGGEQALTTWLHRLTASVGGSQLATFQRFISYWKLYLNAVTREAQLREHGEVLDLDLFEKLRRDYSSVSVSLVISGYALGIDLPDEVFNHPAFTTMYLAATDMVCMSNVSISCVCAIIPV